MADLVISKCLPEAQRNVTARYELSDVDALAMPIMVPFFHIYEYKHDNPSARKELFEAMKIGLEKTIAQFPIQLGRVHKDPKTQKYTVHRTAEDEGVLLLAKSMINLPSDLPSFADLEATFFHPTSLPSEKLLPLEKYDARTQAASYEGMPCLLLQITFIRGGLILASSANHLVSDGQAHDNFMSHWAKNTRNPNSTDRADVNLDRSFLTSQKRCSEGQVDALKTLLDETCGATLKPMQRPSPEALAAKTARKLVHFPKGKTQVLKATLTNQLQSNVSTIDCITALVWRCITRARLPLRKPELTALSSFYVGVGFRGRADVNLPTNYFGNAVMLLRAGPVEIGQILSPEGLAPLAGVIRKTILTVDNKFVSNLVDWSGSVQHDEHSRIAVNSHMTMDVLFSSWADNSCYESMDFGFGLPQAFTSPDHKVETCILLPPRSWAGSDEGLMMNFGLEEGCMERLMHDPEFLEYAEQRGI